MNSLDSGRLWLNPRGLNHSGGVARWANLVLKPLHQSLRISTVNSLGLESPNHLVTRIAELIGIPLKIQKQDLLISPCNWGPLIENQFLVLHDISPLIYPENFVRNYSKFANFMIPQLIKKVKTIATVSNFSRQEICRRFDLDESTVHVLGAAPGLAKNGKVGTSCIEVAENSEYMILIGGHDSRKNLKFLIEIWPEIFRQQKLKLLVVSSIAISTFPVFKTKDYLWMIEIINPNDAELIFLIKNAIALLSPSIYEGYGMPVVEALSLGTPVISSITGVANEITCTGLTLLQLDGELWIQNILQFKRTSFTYNANTWEEVANRMTRVIRGSL